MALKDLSIRKKLIIYSVMVIVLLSVIASMSIYSYNKIESSYLKVQQTVLPNAVATERITVLFRSIFENINKLSSPQNQGNPEIFEQHFTELDRWFAKYIIPQDDYKQMTIYRSLLIYKNFTGKITKQLLLNYEQRAHLLNDLNQTYEVINEIPLQENDDFTDASSNNANSLLVKSRNLCAETIDFVSSNQNNEKRVIQNKSEQLKNNLAVLRDELQRSAEAGKLNPDIQRNILKAMNTSQSLLNLSEEISSLLQKSEKYQRQISSTLKLAGTMQNNELDTLTNNISMTAARSKLILVILAIVSSAFALLVTEYFTRLITSSLSALIKSTRIMSKGNFRHRTVKLYNDEIGTLADSFNLMAQELEDLTYKVDNLNHEIAEREKAQKLVEVANGQLAHFNEELSQTAHKLEQANQELKDFVYIASHDLREPLRKISSFGGMLKESLEGKLSPDDNENMKFMIDGAERMTKMIEGLLMYSRLGTQESSFEEVDLNEAVEQIKELEVAKTLEETKGIIDVPQTLPTIYANPIQIRQVFQNLISNGIKYHAPGVQPRIEITSLAEGDDKVRINIKDNGIGIEEKYFTEIFKMFRRLHSRREYEGTGIGLSICKKIVEKHKGTIGIESEPGKGSTFWFVLPLMRRKESEQLQEAAQSSNR